MEKSPIKEGIKEVLRWVVFYVVSYIITETLSQLNLIPEFYKLKVFVFTYNIPIRETLRGILTLAQRFVDKALHEYRKDKVAGTKYVSKSYGILPF